MLLLKIPDLIGMLQGEGDIIQPLQQAALAERIYLKGQPITRRGDHALLRQIDLQPIAFVGLALGKQPIHHRRILYQRQHAVLEAVVVKNIGKRWRNHTTKAVILQRPRRMFA